MSGTSPRAAGRGRTTARRRLAQAVAWALDYVWIVREQVAALRAPAPDALTTGERAPVVLLPGIYETWPVMRALARALHDAGHPVHTVPALGRNGRPLDASARLVADRLRALDLRGVVLVAHSKGGLIGKLVLADPDVGPRVAGLVAVGAPFSGSAYARWFPARAVRALSPVDPDLLALTRDVATHGRIWSVSTRFDPHVPGGSRLPGAVNVEVPVDGHFRSLADPRVHAAVLDGVAALAAGVAGAGPAPSAGPSADAADGDVR